MVGLGGESQANEPCLRMICPDTWVETKLKPPSFLDDSTCGSMRVRHVPVIIISIHVV